MYCPIDMTDPIKYIPADAMKIIPQPKLGEKTYPSDKPVVIYNFPQSPGRTDENTVYDGIDVGPNSNIAEVTIYIKDEAGIPDTPLTPENNYEPFKEFKTIPVPEDGVIYFQPDIVTNVILLKPSPKDENAPFDLDLKIHACIEGLCTVYIIYIFDKILNTCPF